MNATVTARVTAFHKEMRCSVTEAKASVQTVFSRVLESLRNREIFLLNQLDMIHQTSEDLLAEQALQLLDLPDSVPDLNCTSEENGDDKPDTDLTGCMVTFDADLSSLRSAIHQFGRITTSQSLLPDCHGIMDVPVMSGRSEKQQKSSISVNAENVCNEFVMVDDCILMSDNAEDGEWIYPSVILPPASEQLHFNDEMENGQTVFPELGVSVTVSEATGQCCVSYGLEAADADAIQMDLKKLALAESRETPDADGAVSFAPSVSPLTSYFREISVQPAEFWLACTLALAVENSSVEILSQDIEEVPEVNGFVRYVEAVRAEPLEFWLCPGCEPELPGPANPTSNEPEIVESVDGACPEQLSDVSDTFCHDRVLFKPSSFSVISQRSDGMVSGESSLSPCSSFCVSDVSAVFPHSQQTSDNTSNHWMSQSSFVNSDEMEVLVNVANGTSVSFEFISRARSSTDMKKCC